MWLGAAWKTGWALRNLACTHAQPTCSNGPKVVRGGERGQATHSRLSGCPSVHIYHANVCKFHVQHTFRYTPDTQVFNTPVKAVCTPQSITIISFNTIPRRFQHHSTTFSTPFHDVFNTIQQQRFQHHSTTTFSTTGWRNNQFN